MKIWNYKTFLEKRRSIRKYKQQPVEKEKIEEMIQAAIYQKVGKIVQTPPISCYSIKRNVGTI